MDMATHLSFAVRPEIHRQSDHLIDCGVRSLVEECRGEGCQREEGEAGLQAAVDARAGQEAKGPLPCEENDAKEQVDGLEHRNGLDGPIERLGEEIPEYLGPEEPLQRGGYLVCRSSVSNEP